MQLASRFPDEARELITVRGRDLLDTLGLPALRSVVTDVLGGVNVRSATEGLTRRRLNVLNAGMLHTYAGLLADGVEPLSIPELAYHQHQHRGMSPEDKVVLRWMLGLTQKQVQNVLRSNDLAWVTYIESLKEALQESADSAEESWGAPPVQLADKEVPWTWVLSMLMAVGAQTLAIRGAEKSLYGKFFEKLVLGSVLSVLGFGYCEPEKVLERSFWLSTRGSKRESDATAIWNLGQGVRFDIGFIGVGNTEITLDKVSRFERETEIQGHSHYMKTFIIIDRVGRGSRVPELASEIGGTVIQMSANNWVQTLGDELAKALDDYDSPVAGLPHAEYMATMREGVASAPLERIFEVAVSD